MKLGLIHYKKTIVLIVITKKAVHAEMCLHSLMKVKESNI